MGNSNSMVNYPFNFEVSSFVKKYGNGDISIAIETIWTKYFKNLEKQSISDVSSEKVLFLKRLYEYIPKTCVPEREVVLSIYADQASRYLYGISRKFGRTNSDMDNFKNMEILLHDVHDTLLTPKQISEKLNNIAFNDLKERLLKTPRWIKYVTCTYRAGLFRSLYGYDDTSIECAHFSFNLNISFFVGKYGNDSPGDDISNAVNVVTNNDITNGDRYYKCGSHESETFFLKRLYEYIPESYVSEKEKILKLYSYEAHSHLQWVKCRFRGNNISDEQTFRNMKILLNKDVHDTFIWDSSFTPEQNIEKRDSLFFDRDMSNIIHFIRRMLLEKSEWEKTFKYNVWLTQEMLSLL